MLGTRDRQCKLFAAATQLGATVLGQLGFYGQLATAAHPLFEDEDFQAASCADTGRPSCPPSMLATARLLQHDAGVSDAEVVERFLGGLLHDCAQVVAWAEAADCASDEVALLRKVIAQDIEPQTPEGPPRIQHGVAPDRTVSVHDPEMRHGRKSSGTVYTGHKAHIAVEVTRGVITAVEVSAPARAYAA